MPRRGQTRVPDMEIINLWDMMPPRQLAPLLGMSVTALSQRASILRARGINLRRWPVGRPRA